MNGTSFRVAVVAAVMYAVFGVLTISSASLAASPNCDVGDVSFAGVPEPSPPSANVKTELAAFGGSWICGDWGGMFTALVVTDIDNVGNAKGWYAWGKYKNRISPGNQYFEGQIEDGALKFKLFGAQYTFEMPEPHTLDATYLRSDGVSWTATLQKKGE